MPITINPLEVVLLGDCLKKEDRTMITICNQCGISIGHTAKITPTLCSDCVHLAVGGAIKAGDGWTEIFPHARNNPATCNCAECDPNSWRNKEDQTMTHEIHPNDVTLDFSNNGDITMMPDDPDIPDRLIAFVDSEGDIHIEDDAPDFITHDFIMGWLIHTLSMTLELRDIDWTPDAAFMKAAGWDLIWTWDDVSRSWIKK